MTLRGLLEGADFVFVPIALVGTLLCGSSGIEFLPLVALGFIAWTLLEYWLHRAAHVRRFRKLRRNHMAHHQHPRRGSVTAPYTLPIVAALELLAVLKPGVAPVITGFLSGYLAFLVIHWLMHHDEVRGDALPRLTEMHEVHHHGGSERWFGVTTVFWDRVFRTN